MGKCNCWPKGYATYILRFSVWPGVLEHTVSPLRLALGKQRQVVLCEFGANLIDSASSRTVRTRQGDPFKKINDR